MEHYRILVRGHLDRGWAASFPGLDLAHRSDGTTLLCGSVADQAALHGLLQRLGRLDRAPDHP